MIDPEKITEYDPPVKRLEELMLFWICAAGKNGHTAARCLDSLLKSIDDKKGRSPFELVRRTPGLPELMKIHGIGCYNSKARTFKEIARSGLDLKTCTTEELEAIHGIGMKTSRCFIMHSRRDANCAGLDTHILKHLRAKGVKNVPKATPGTKKEYLRLEKEMLKLIKKSGMSAADYDLMIWNKYSVKSEPRT
jgi:3-methyladenine DNA glycosylase/8-oxoguanine DNA glycosylase